MDKDKKRQKIHIEIRVDDLAKLAAIAEELDLNRTDVIRIAIREYIRSKS